MKRGQSGLTWVTRIGGSSRRLSRILQVLVAAASLLGTLAASPSVAAGSRAPDEGAYDLLVFNAPVAGREAEYNDWYDNHHAPDVVSVPGFVSARRYRLADLQLRPVVQPLPQYLVVYRIVTNDLAAVYEEVRRRLQDGRTVLSSSLDVATSRNFTYKVFRPVVRGAGAQRGKGRQSASDYIQLVFADPADGAEVEFNEWYDRHHAPDVASVPGFLDGQRLQLADVQLAPDKPRRSYLTVFRMSTADLSATFAEFGRRAPGMSMSKSFDGSRTDGYTYVAIGPVLSGDRIRQQRSRR